MSAFILSKKSFDALVYAAFYGFYDKYNPINDSLHIYSDNKAYTFTAGTFGQVLVDQNFASVNFRYQESGKPFLYEYALHKEFSNMKPVEILKLCDCYDYQSCETDSYDRTLAANLIHFIRKKVIAALPGYEDAPWGLG